MSHHVTVRKKPIKFTMSKNRDSVLACELGFFITCHMAHLSFFHLAVRPVKERKGKDERLTANELRSTSKEAASNCVEKQ